MADRERSVDLVEAFLSGRLSRRQFTRRLLAAGFSMGAIGAFLAACGGSAATPTSGSSNAAPTAAGAVPTVGVAAGTTTGAAPAAAPTSAPAGKKGGTLVIVRPTDAVALDPHTETTSPGNWVMTNLYETLVILDTDMQIKPGLAERWEQLAPDRWRFSLRKGVKFHDGTDFKADAVKFSIDRIKDPQNPGRSASNLAGIKAVEPKDDYTVEIATDGPYGPLLNILSLEYATGIVSPAAVQKFGKDFGRNPVGTGPFKFVEWKTNDAITIERFDGYWGEKALLDRVVYRVVPEESARMLALQTGEAQMVMAPAPSELASLRKDNKFVVHDTAGVRVVYFGFQTRRAPVDDPRVRQAINHAFDRKPILDNILEGAALPATSYISPGVFGYKDVRANWAYDLPRAEQLLDEAGWKKGTDGFRAKDGKPLTLKHYTPRGRYLKDAECGEAFQAAMRKIGINVELQVLEWATLFGKYRQPGLDAEVFTVGWSTATGDAEYTLGPLFGTANMPPKGWNSFEYSNPKFDELTDRAQRSTDQKERAELYAQALELVSKDAVIVPVYNSLETIATSTGVKGFKIHPIDYYLWLGKVSLDK